MCQHLAGLFYLMLVMRKLAQYLVVLKEKRYLEERDLELGARCSGSLEHYQLHMLSALVLAMLAARPNHFHSRYGSLNLTVCDMNNILYSFMSRIIKSYRIARRKHIGIV